MLITQNRKIKKYINQLARIDNSFLVIGEPGSGKKTVVEEIHRKSKRKDRQVIFLNCSALGNSLNDTDIYSKFEEAQNGMLCLENFDEMPAKYQKLFYNILKEGYYTNPVSKEKIKLNFRISVVTSNEKIKSTQSPVRQDLVSLIDKFTVLVQPLRKRKQDIQPLFNYFLEETCREKKIELPDIPENLTESLINYDWPGNITELKTPFTTLYLCHRKANSILLIFLLKSKNTLLNFWKTTLFLML